MSDQVQLPPPPPVTSTPRVTPVRVADPVEPATKSQADNQSNGHRSGDNNGQSQQAQTANRQLTITREPALQSFVYRSIDGDSGEVVWQYPAEQVLRRARHLRELEDGKHSGELDEKA